MLPQFRGYASADPDRPDVSKWNLFSKSSISVIVSDKIKYYLGMDLIYQNPDNLNEFVRQIRVITPFVVVKSKKELDKNFIDMMTTYVTDGTQRELMKSYEVKSDPILFIHWKVADDIERGTKKLDGKDEVWFWNSFGEWVYAQDAKIKFTSTSEIFKETGSEPVIVGIKYSLNLRDYNAREVPFAYIAIAVKSLKGGK
jgi:hypothetical protein